MDNWLFQKEELKQFLKDLLDCVRVTQDFAALGFLGYCLRSEDLTLPQVLQGLHDLQAAQAKPLGLLEKLFHITREEPFQVRDLPAPKTMAVPSFAIEEEEWRLCGTKGTGESDAGAACTGLQLSGGSEVMEQHTCG